MIVVLSGFGAAAPAMADAIGQMTPRATACGYVFGAGWLALDDSDGAPRGEFTMQPFAVACARRVSAVRRYWLEPYFQRATFDAATDRVGQDISRAGVRMSIQHFLPQAAGWLPWVGVGIDFSQTRQSARHTVDTGGYLAARYDDRHRTHATLLINASREWRLPAGRRLNAKIEYTTPVGGELTALSASIAYLFGLSR